MDDEDLEFLFPNPPWRIGGPSRWLLASGSAVVVAAIVMAVLAVEQKTGVLPRILISGVVFILGVYRIGIGCKCVSAAEEVLTFHGWFGVEWNQLRPHDVGEVTVVPAADGESQICVHLQSSAFTFVTADHALATWLDHRGILIPRFGTWSSDRR